MAELAPGGKDLAYLELLAARYPSIRSASSAIVNLSASLQLPKGTEHFLSDIHGEYEVFAHVLRSGSGSIKRKIDELFGERLSEAERRDLATLIYYPSQRLARRRLAGRLQAAGEEAPEDWFRSTLHDLIHLCRVVASKYSRAAVRAALPTDFAFIIDELLHEQEAVENRSAYYDDIISTIITIGSAEAFIVALAELIQRLEIAHLHILGDIFDRSPGAHRILDDLLHYHSVDVQWGNHDILWMGAAAGSDACIANVIRISLRYGNLETIENGYAISLLPLASFAMDEYGSDPCEQFALKVADQQQYTRNELVLMARMQKAITIIQLKLEAQIIRSRPEYEMDDRLLLDKIDFDQGTVELGGRQYPLLDRRFPTVNPADPYALTERECSVVEKLRLNFTHSEKLQEHVRFLLSHGSMYLVYNGNLLYHGCIPLNPDGSFRVYREGGREYWVRAFLDHLDRLVRQGMLASEPAQRQAGQDAMWYLWSGPGSPLFGKDKMATFERYFLADKSTHAERKDPYYDYRDLQATAERILAEFGLDPARAHIVNGHVPVKVSKGESPVKAGGRLLVIDGGFARAYQSQTGIAGYTLIYNSYGFLLAAHEPFESTQKAIEEEADIHSRTSILETNDRRIRVQDTDQGRQVQAQIADLKALLAAYRGGLIKER